MIKSVIIFNHLFVPEGILVRPFLHNSSLLRLVIIFDLGAEEKNCPKNNQQKDKFADLLRANGASDAVHAVCPMAAVITRSCVASLRSKMAICRPSRMTTMRSLMANTSGRSEEIMMMPMPC